VAIAFLIGLIFLAGIFLTLRRTLGLRMLRFVTLIPVVVTIGVVIKIGTPQLDATLSARPLSVELAQMETKPLPVAVYGVRRETEYGLAFYRNQNISRYELQQIPPGEHLVVAPQESVEAIAQFVRGRRVSHLGTFSPQRLEYYWVAKAN
jgi:hypothetical protein